MEKINYPFEIREFNFKNGLKIVILKGNIPTTHIYLTALCGTNDEPLCKNGILNLITHQISRNLKNFSSSNEAVKPLKNFDFSGVYIEHTHGNSINFRYLENLLKHFFNFHIFPKDFNELKRKAAESLSQKNLNPMDNYFNILRRLIFRTTPYQFPPSGTSGTIKNIQIEDLINFHKLYFKISNTLLLIAGNKPIEEIYPLFEKINPKNSSEFERPHLQEIPESKRFLEFFPIKEETTYLLIGKKGIKLNSKIFFELKLLEYILGWGKNGTLNLIADLFNRKINFKNPFSNFTYESSRREGAIFFFSEIVENDPLNLAEEIMKALKLAKNFILKREIIERAKREMIKDFYSQFRSTDNYINYFLTLKTCKLSIDRFSKYAEFVNSVKPEDIYQTYKKFLNVENFSIVVAKNYE